MSEIVELKPHDEWKEEYSKYAKIFLAGTIDNGDSEDWQRKYVEIFKTNHTNDSDDANYILFNPRRDNWDKNASKDELDYQIRWELDKLEASDHIIMNILPGSKSPISLLELGLFHKKMTVICPPEFYRYDNVRIVCERYGVELLNDFHDLKI